jgi:peptidoglycan hydrolase-like protein with peptidoglycan-binding domain
MHHNNVLKAGGVIGAFMLVAIATHIISGSLPIDTSNTQQAAVGSIYPETSGDRVIDLQEKLLEAGYYKGSITGFYDHNTETAVTAFQKSEGLVNDGIAGVNTYSKLTDLISQSQNATWVSFASHEVGASCAVGFGLVDDITFGTLVPFNNDLICVAGLTGLAFGQEKNTGDKIVLNSKSIADSNGDILAPEDWIDSVQTLTCTGTGIFAITTVLTFDNPPTHEPIGDFEAWDADHEEVVANCNMSAPSGTANI